MTDPTRDQAFVLAFVATALLAATTFAAAARPIPRAAVQTRDFGCRIDVNHADVAALRLLPGVGAVTARYIIDRRTEHGPLANADDLIAVPRLGPKTVARMLPYVIFETSPTTGHN